MQDVIRKTQHKGARNLAPVQAREYGRIGKSTITPAQGRKDKRIGTAMNEGKNEKNEEKKTCKEYG
ncbi:hypothetical protein ACE38V_08350 [Cytobacillus sp. Hz8]|uniref:hypothetical protein n=1 Tax=Cytobacillus sp. Hz8 TaxID=3347168 RepID=UPI0035DEE150